MCWFRPGMFLVSRLVGSKLGKVLFSHFCSWGEKLCWFRPGMFLVSRLLGWAETPVAERSRSQESKPFYVLGYLVIRF